MFQSGITIQLIAEQLTNGNYVHCDSEYFDDPEKMKDWLSGAVEWADRFRIFKVGHCDFFFEGVVVKHRVPKWEKVSMDKLERVDVYA